MTDIITFYKKCNHEEPKRMFGHVSNGKFIIKSYVEETNEVHFNYWGDFNSNKSLLEHVEDYFKFPGLKMYTFDNPIICKNDVGKYYPRIFRKGLDQFFSQQVVIFKNYDVITLNKSIISATLLLKKLNQLFETISFDEANFKTFGHEIRNLLLLACMEVESAWNGILTANEYGIEIKNKTTKDYVKLCEPLYLNDYEVSFKLYPNIKPIKPFQSWNVSNPTQSLFWYDAYNKTKHNRETHSELASFESTIYSVSAVLIMLYAQFGPNQSFWNQTDFLNISLNCPEHNLKDYYIPNADYSKTSLYEWEKKNFIF